LREALTAAEACGRRRPPRTAPPLVPAPEAAPELLSESEAKALLARHGLRTPRGGVTGRADLMQAARGLTAPLVLKVQGLAHKSEAGGVRLGLAPEALAAAAEDMGGDSFLVEEMVTGAVCELLVGVLRDAAHGIVLTLGAGGVLTELWRDRVSLLLPASREEVASALTHLRIHPLLLGYRGAPAADLDAVLDAIMAVQACAAAEATRLYEVEINPLICTPETAVAVDALVSRLPEPPDAGDRDETD
jgi:acetyl-CoA synthetase